MHDAHCFDPVHTPFSTREVSEITLEPVDRCLRDRNRGILNSSISNANRESKELNTHSFVDCVEYVLKLRLWEKTNTRTIQWQSLELALDWICRSIDDEYEFDRIGLNHLDEELRCVPFEYATVSQVLDAELEYAFASLVLNFWISCSYRCHYYLLGQRTFEHALIDNLNGFMDNLYVLEN